MNPETRQWLADDLRDFHMLRSAIIAITHKIYLDKCFEHMTTEENC